MKILILLMTVFLAVPLFAHDSVKLKAMEKRLQEVEKQLVTLTSSTAPVVAKAESDQIAEQQRKKARERMRLDAKIYSQEERQEIESLYQVANKKWRSEEGKESLRKMIAKYDKANRTGCALLYLGQMSEGDEREEYLLKAIEGFSDCYYGDGVQVGAYARYYLAYYYKDQGKKSKAEDLFEEIRTDYPNAIGHKRQLLVDVISDE